MIGRVVVQPVHAISRAAKLPLLHCLCCNRSILTVSVNLQELCQQYSGKSARLPGTVQKALLLGVMSTVSGPYRT
jgi:hypothetical protein